MKKLIVASNNEHKILEIKEILKNFHIDVVSLKEAGIDVDVEENGTTFMENAHIKAEAIHKMIGDSMVMADDSGLVVDALNGEPGVYSARYCGEHGNDKKNNEKLLEKLKNVDKDKRNAKFVCAIEVIGVNGKVINAQGEVEGVIVEEERGKDGFGYDPLFYVEEFKKTFAEMTSEEKNSISHRGRALNIVQEKMKDLI